MWTRTPAVIALLAFASSSFAQAPPGAPKELVVYPAQIKLSGARDEQRVIVLGVWADGRKFDLTHTATLTSANAKITLAEKGLVRPVADGNTTITVEASGARAQLSVVAEKIAVDVPVSFAREIQPIFTKAGCNAGACHGASLGRGGFRLSLFGFDNSYDYAQIVQSNEGRRVVVNDPERSILLAKPSLVMEHGGGERLKQNGRDYNRVRQWLEDGAPAPNAKTDPEVAKLEVFPAARVLLPGEKQQLAVTAIWSDGKREDVTSTAQFDALNDAVASVTRMGLVTANEKGETHVMIRFGGQAAVAQVTLPFAKLDKFPDVPTNNFIDEKLIAKWKELGLTPSPLAGDDEFLRRLYLDAIGHVADAGGVRVPRGHHRRSARGDRQDTRSRRVHRLVGRKWGDCCASAARQEKGCGASTAGCGQVRDNVPVDAFVRIYRERSTFIGSPAN